MLHIKETEKPRKEEGKTRVLMAAANWKGEWGWQGQERAGDGKHSRHSLCPVKTCTEACWLTQRPSVAFAITKEGDPRCTPSSAIEPFSLPFYIISHFLLLVIFHLSHVFISLLLSWKWDCFTSGAIRLAHLSTICIGNRIREESGCYFRTVFWSWFPFSKSAVEGEKKGLTV